jgi:hypothetical protein
VEQGTILEGAPGAAGNESTVWSTMGCGNGQGESRTTTLGLTDVDLAPMGVGDLADER